MNRKFNVAPNKIAAETHFYRLPESWSEFTDPLIIEKNLSQLEANSSRIIEKIKNEIDNSEIDRKLSISQNEKLILSEFIATQYFRTLELRELLMYFLKDEELIEDNLSDDEKKSIQFHILAESEILEKLEESIYNSIWIFAKNVSHNPLITSDHPICMKTKNNKMWIKGIEPLIDGSYIVFPITPKLILYCKEFNYWSMLKDFDLSISPIQLDADMVDHENSGQAFMSSRFLFSPQNEFYEIQEFISSIGTNKYAIEKNEDALKAIERTKLYINRQKN